MDQLAIANQVLDAFSITRIEKRPAGYYVCWGKHAKRWACRNQDFYPIWSQEFPGGGTASTALSQLIRWLRKEPVLSLQTWRYWAGEKCKLLPASAVDLLASAGYPEKDHCVLCGIEITGDLDWWSNKKDKITGPCCGWNYGCKQKGESPF